MATSTPAAIRAKKLLLASFVSDAASTPLHWIYDVPKLNELVKNGKNPAEKPEFFDPPSCPFYTLPIGELSPWGGECVSLLEHLAKHTDLDPAAYARESYEFFKNYTGRLNHLSKDFMEKVESGQEYPNVASESTQAHSIIKVPILVARYGGQEKLLDQVELAVRVHQSSDMGVSMALASAVILDSICTGSSIRDATNSALAHDRVPADAKEAIQATLSVFEEGLSIPDAIDKFGKSCALPGAFQGALYVLLRTNDFQSAVRLNIMAGGDNCSRSMLIGACAVAAYDADIPAEWGDKTCAWKELETLAEKVVSNAQV